MRLLDFLEGLDESTYQRAEAWCSVTKLLDTLAIKWARMGDTGNEGVINAILDLATKAGVVGSCEYPNPVHKHRDLIIAWANGAEIEYFCTNKKIWIKLINPQWILETQYRIKPVKSAKDIEIESIQAEMKRLEERMNTLKDSK